MTALFCHNFPFIAITLWITVMMTGCIQSPRPVQKSHTSHPQTDLSKLTERTLKTHATSWRQASALRDLVDQDGMLGSCARSNTLSSMGQRAWVEAWCAHRVGRAEDVLIHAPWALRYFGDLGDLRRQAEMYGLMALAHAKLNKHLMAQVYGQKSRKVILNAQLSMIGDLKDTYAGDLPYLLGQLARYGVIVNTAPTHKGDWTRLFLSMAINEYQSTKKIHAQSHALRARAQYALNQGQFHDANQDLQNALMLARQYNLDKSVYETAVVVADLAQAQNQEVFAQQLESWLVVKQGHDFLPLPDRLTNWPAQSDEMQRMMRTTSGRRALLEYIRRIRRTPSLALNPPEHMLKQLTAFKHGSLLHGDGWALSYEIGQLLHERGQIDDARRYFEWAIHESERLRHQFPDPRARQIFFKNKRELYLDLIHSYVGIDTAKLTQGDYFKALRWTSALKARGLMDLMQDSVPTGTSKRPMIQIQENHPMVRVRKTMSRALKQWHIKTPSSPPRLEMISKASLPKLKAKTLMVEFVLGKRAGYVWVIDGKKLHMRRIAGTRTLAPLIKAFRKTLILKQFDKKQAANHRKYAERLFVALFGPVQDLITRANHLIIAPDDILHDLPFEALAKPSKNKHIPHYVVHDASLSYVPSSLVLKDLLERKVQAKAGKSSALLMGNPQLDAHALNLLGVSSGRAFQQETGSLQSLFPSMPGSKKEVKAIASDLQHKMQVTTFLGNQATESALMTQELKSFSLIHLSTHGLSDATPWQNRSSNLKIRQPTLLFGTTNTSPHDGLVKLDEIVGLKTNANLVVLSGCTTGRGWQSLGDGAYGLAGAFLSTGAQAVMASMWNVADLATAHMMRLFYHQLKQNQDAAQALRKTQIKMIRYKSSAHKQYLPPYYWASFRVVGLAWRAKL